MREPFTVRLDDDLVAAVRARAQNESVGLHLPVVVTGYDDDTYASAQRTWLSCEKQYVESGTGWPN